MSHPRFIKGDKIVYIPQIYLVTRGIKKPSDVCVKYGTIERLRDDTHERDYVWPYGNFYYAVKFDDGSYQTYVAEKHMVPNGDV